MAFQITGYICTFVIAYLASRLVRLFLGGMGETAGRAILAMVIVWGAAVALVTAQAPGFNPRPAVILVTPPILALLALDLLLLGRRREKAARRARSRSAVAAMAEPATDAGG